MDERICETLETALWEALQEVKDPEIPTVSVVELGMVHRVAAEGGGSPWRCCLPSLAAQPWTSCAAM
jgi:Predicted metal-sulfur cluster biosynthetic enzyme